MFKRFYPYEYVDSVFSIDYQKLKQKGYKGIIFDIDNTLVHHGDDSTPEIDKLFEQIHSMGLKTFLLSNNGAERVKSFIQNIDTLFICNADKPNTTGFFSAVEMLHIKKEEALVIGDQIFTDILGANRCGIACILVKFIRLKTETGIGKKRYFESLLLKCWKKNQKYYHRLGDICKEGAEEPCSENFFAR